MLSALVRKLRIFNIQKREKPNFSDLVYRVGMDIEHKERLARIGDISPEAVRARLLAARSSVGMKQQDVAKAVGLKKSTFNSQEMRGAPSAITMRYYHRQHRIDFNFILHGDFAQLPQDVQERLFAELAASTE
ncbi:XRE family transcriptional regulator [Pukyongiella litopenaei]|uniref:XRE family transcriptional regulator n=1 Tax=Pukyongiella litopenaei TaxID=2605946 RepID=A0A2S0MNF6_9RHOB|nr:XRE family transcriptional regulator [Pukyongiella litopenaei]AVO37367.2 XRE family transcriptional regulator [Pukyongiella litopenaei]